MADLYRFPYRTAMKTTLDLDDELVKRAKAHAARERKSLTALIEEELRLRLRRRSAASGARVDLPVFTGGRGFAAGTMPRMMTPDVNVLLAALRDNHPHHEVARSWLLAALTAAASGQSLVVLPMVAAGVLRVATHSKVFEPPTPLPLCSISWISS
jgi:hypothetical protein